MAPPMNPPKGCFTPGCPNLTHSTYCTTHTAKHSKIYDKKRGSPTARGYNYRWVKESTAFKMRHPLCVECMKHDIVQSAEVVDHIVPHKGDMTLFWSVDNWQSLCRRCHSTKTAKEDGGLGNPILKGLT